MKIKKRKKEKKEHLARSQFNGLGQQVYPIVIVISIAVKKYQPWLGMDGSRSSPQNARDNYNLFF